MTVQQLRYVVAVAEAGSITEAARQLFLSQPSLSSAIKELEGEIGRPLFLRGRTGITLTREGMEFLGYARQVLRQMEVLEDRYVAKRPEKVRFGVSAQHYTFAENAFVELVKEYGQDRYEFYYNATGTHQILEDVKNRICELGVIYLSAENEAALGKVLEEIRPGLCAHVLCPAPRVPAKGPPSGGQGPGDAGRPGPLPPAELCAGGIRGGVLRRGAVQRGSRRSRDPGE